MMRELENRLTRISGKTGSIRQIPIKRPRLLGEGVGGEEETLPTEFLLNPQPPKSPSSVFSPMVTCSPAAGFLFAHCPNKIIQEQPSALNIPSFGFPPVEIAREEIEYGQ